jgi:Flp pilus assembly pilin Flp
MKTGVFIVNTIGKRAHNIVEYSLVIGVVTVALMAMNTYFKRGIQGIIKVVADDMGDQGESFTNSEEEFQEPQIAAALKSHYGFEHQFVYTQNDTGQIGVRNSGQGSINTETLSNSIVTQQSYGSGGELLLDEQSEKAKPDGDEP